MGLTRGRTFVKQLVSQDRVCTHLRPYTNDTAHELLIASSLGTDVGGVELFVDVIEVRVDLFQPTTSRKIYSQ